jgi:hypothetical protein
MYFQNFNISGNNECLLLRESPSVPLRLYSPRMDYKISYIILYYTHRLFPTCHRHRCLLTKDLHCRPATTKINIIEYAYI